MPLQITTNSLKALKAQTASNITKLIPSIRPSVHLTEGSYHPSSMTVNGSLPSKCQGETSVGFDLMDPL